MHITSFNIRFFNIRTSCTYILLISTRITHICTLYIYTHFIHIYSVYLHTCTHVRPTHDLHVDLHVEIYKHITTFNASWSQRMGGGLVLEQVGSCDTHKQAWVYIHMKYGSICIRGVGVYLSRYQFINLYLPSIYIWHMYLSRYIELLICTAVCCRVLPCVAVCCSVLQCVAACCRVLQCVAVYFCRYITLLTCTAVC